MFDVQLIGRIAIEEKSPIAVGVAWLENKIYGVCHMSKRVHVFPDQQPFDELKDDRIEVKEMKNLTDMHGGQWSQSIDIHQRL